MGKICIPPLSYTQLAECDVKSYNRANLAQLEGFISHLIRMSSNLLSYFCVTLT